MVALCPGITQIAQAVCIVAIAGTLPSGPGLKETWRPPVRSAAACDSDPQCRYSPEAKFLDHSNRVETGSCFPQPIVGCSDKGASDRNPRPVFVGAFLSP